MAGVHTRRRRAVAEPRREGPRRLQQVGAEHWPLAVVAGGYLLAAAFVPSLAQVAISDDWIYTLSVEILLDEGRLRILDPAAASAVPQILWGGLFGALFGPTFGTLRVATIVAMLFGGWAIYAACRALSLNGPLAGLGMAMFLFNPLSIGLAFTFMSDPYYTVLVAITAWLFLRAVAGGSSERRWLLAGACVAALLFLQRAPGLLLPGAMAAFVAVHRPTWHRLGGVRAIGIILAPTVVVAAAFQLWLQLVHGMPEVQRRVVHYLMDTPLDRVPVVVGRLGYAEVLYVGLFLVGPAIGLLPTVPRIARRLGSGGWFLVGAVLLALWWGMVSDFGRTRLMPSLPQFVAPWGMGPADLLGGRPILLPPGWLQALLVVSVGSAVVLTLCTASWWLNRRETPAMGLLILLVFSQTAAYVLPSFTFRENFISFDRYLLSLLPIVCCIGVWFLHWLGARRTPAWIVVCAFGTLALVGMRDFLVLQNAVWELAAEANAMGIENTRLDAGYAWDAYHLWAYSHARQMPPQTPDGPFWVREYAPATDSTYVVAVHDLPDYQRIAERPVPVLLGKDQRLVLQRRPNVAGPP